MFSNVLFCSSNSPTFKDIYFIMISEKEIKQILTFEKLEPDKIWYFSQFFLKNDFIIDYQKSS